MPRKTPKPEDVFYDSTVNIIKNMFTDANPNFKSYHYASTMSPFEYQTKIKEMAQTVLDKIESWKHLIELPIPKITWTSQEIWFGLDYSSKTGKWNNYSFDIRYDYDGKPNIKPTTAGCFVLISRRQNEGNGVAAGWEKTIRIEDKFGKTPEELMKYCQEWLEKEYETFLNG